MDLSSETSSDESSKASDRKHKYSCTYEGCKASFSRNKKFIYHIRRHTGERPFVCEEPNCGKTYLYSFHLRRHKETHHGNHSVERVPYPCTYEGCYRELANKYSLKKHIKLKHERRYPFSCDECQQGFLRKRQLLQHSYVHTGVFPFICEICGTRFPTTTDRSRHQRTHTSYSCSCNESFERWSSLLAHKRICGAARPKCNICNKTFTQSINLQSHLQVHLKEKVNFYFCGYENCTRSYSYKKNLIYHINKCHKKTSVQRIACTHEGCQQSFIKMQNLKNHVSRFHSNDKIIKKKKQRKPRKDKGLSRTSTAALLSGVALPAEMHRAIIKGESVKLPLVPKDTNLNKPICSLKENDDHVENIKQNTTDAEQRCLKQLKAKLQQVLLKNLAGSSKIDCKRNDNENSKSCVKVLC